MIDLKGKCCIVTGAGKGFGREIAKVLAEYGCKLALISRTESDLLDLEQNLNMPAGDLYWECGDVSDPAVVKSFVAQVNQKFDSINVLINNAGMRFRKPFLEITPEEWELVIGVNLNSTFFFCQEVGKQMIKQRSGKIINMASVVGNLGLPELAGYGASKGGIISLTKCLALEWAQFNIHVNVLAPGFCKTSYAEKFKENKTDLYNFTIERTPLKRWGEPKEVANTCIFLASSMSDYITGEVLNIDGGWSAW